MSDTHRQFPVRFSGKQIKFKAAAPIVARAVEQLVSGRDDGAIAEMFNSIDTQKRVQGSHFANDDQSYAMNELALNGQLNPCMSRAFTYDDLPLSHQLMHDNKHPHGNMSVLIGAPDFGLGMTASAPSGIPKAKLPKGDTHDTPHPYPLSAPLPEVDGDLEEIELVDDGAKVRDRMHPGIISCSRSDSLGQAAKTMIDNDIHALVAIEGEKAVGVLSQTDIVLARQGRTVDDARGLSVGEVTTQGCATVEVDAC